MTLHRRKSGLDERSGDGKKNKKDQSGAQNWLQKVAAAAAAAAGTKTRTEEHEPRKSTNAQAAVSSSMPMYNLSYASDRHSC